MTRPLIGHFPQVFRTTARPTEADRVLVKPNSSHVLQVDVKTMKGFLRKAVNLKGWSVKISRASPLGRAGNLGFDVGQVLQHWHGFHLPSLRHDSKI